MLLNTDMKIFNGRKIGDLSGSFTCYEWKGQNLIDYFITSDNFFSLVKYLKVEDKTEVSDHCRITCALKHPLQRVFRMSQVRRASIWNSIHFKWVKNRRYRKSNFKPFQNHCWTKIFSFHGEYE